MASLIGVFEEIEHDLNQEGVRTHPIFLDRYIIHSDNLIDAGFIDAWSQIDPLDPGYTCCEAANLPNANPSLDTRIDLVLMRDEVGLRHRPIVVGFALETREHP